jgi:HdeA/HdeB family
MPLLVVHKRDWHLTSFSRVVRFRKQSHAISKARNTAMKKLIAFSAITSLVLAETAAEDRIDRIDLTGFSCKQFLQMNRDDALIVVGWLQGYYLDEHAPPVVDFARLSVDSVSLANRCAARPDENVMTAADRVFGK